VFIEYRTDSNPYLREQRVKPRPDNKSRRGGPGGTRKRRPQGR
jgi:hypothetical protein